MLCAKMSWVVFPNADDLNDYQHPHTWCLYLLSRLRPNSWDFFFFLNKQSSCRGDVTHTSKNVYLVGNEHILCARPPCCQSGTRKEKNTIILNFWRKMERFGRWSQPVANIMNAIWRGRHKKHLQCPAGISVQFSTLPCWGCSNLHG